MPDPSQEWYGVQFAWDRYLLTYYYNNPNEPLETTLVIQRHDGWYVVRPDTREEVFMGHTADEAVQAIDSSRAAAGLRITRVEPTNVLIQSR